MTSDDSVNAGTTPEVSHAQTLGEWVTTLAEDAQCVAEVSQQFPPGAPLRAPLRAGLRHLLHIARLSQGIEALAMVEVSIMLRVTALLATPAEELDSETVIRLRADTELIEELFPNEKEVIWRFCQSLIEAERELPSEQPSVGTPPPAKGDTDSARELELEASGASPEPAASSETRAVAHATSESAAHEDGASEPARDAAESALGEMETEFGSDAPVAATPPSTVLATDELIERIGRWVEGYRSPTFGGKPHDLTRVCAFVRTRVAAWNGS